MNYTRLGPHLKVEAEAAAFKLLALQAPVAGDLGILRPWVAAECGRRRPNGRPMHSTSPRSPAAADVAPLGRYYERFAYYAVEVGRGVVFEVTDHTA